MANWFKLPGLFYRWEFEDVIEVDGEHEYRFERCGSDDHNRDLVAVYCRVRGAGTAGQLAEVPPVPTTAKAARGAA